MTGALEKKLDFIKKAVVAKETAKIYKFPGWGDPQRGVPNYLVRCAIFAAVKGVDGKYNEDMLVFSQNGFRIAYSGPTLTQDHLDVFEGVMHLARSMHEGNAVRFTARGLLKLIGRSTGKSDHVRLVRALKHLTTTAITIKHEDGRVYWGSLLPEGTADLENGQYCVFLNRQLIKLFEHGFTVIEQAQRKALARSPLAKHLQLWLSSHDKPYPVTVQYLHCITGSNTKQRKKFRQSLKSALNRLKEVGVLKDWHLDEGDKVHFVKAK